MITARTTRLVRVPDLQTFRRVAGDRSCDGTPRDVRDRLVLVPTHAAAAYLTAAIERRQLDAQNALVLPDFVTRAELYPKFAERLAEAPLPLGSAERAVLMGVACRATRERGLEPPFRLRAGLIAAILDFYDTLQRHMKSVETFERLALAMLEPSAAGDRGAERLVRQTRFLAAAFRQFEQLRLDAGGADEHLLRQRLLADAAVRPWRHVVVSVGDAAPDVRGLFTADWDLLARVPGLEQLDVIVTEAALAGALHERLHRILPGIDEVVHATAGPPERPTLVVPPGGALSHGARDREEEVIDFARWVRQDKRPLDRTALVVRRPLPYVYLAREVLRSAGMPSQMFDALPLAAEPFAAALDLLFAFVTANFARGPAVALLQSPHFDVGSAADGPPSQAVADLDRALGAGGYLGDVEALERLVAQWDEGASGRSHPAPTRHAAHRLLAAARELAPLRVPAPCAPHLDRLLGFLEAHQRLPAVDDPLRQRLLRGRAAILDVLAGLRDAYARFDATETEFETLVPVVRRRIEERTFAPYTGSGGVHVVDAESARFGDFDRVQLAGLVDGEWPEPPRRNIFFPPSLLRALGWPSESRRLEQARAAFSDLLRLPSRELVVSTFTLEDDAIVAASPLIDALAGSGLPTVEHTPAAARIFDEEALAGEPIELQHLPDTVRAAAGRRIAAARAPRGSAGLTRPGPLPAYAVSALERYQDCPFKFFASDVLRLEEPVEDESTLTPRARGRLLHELFQRFFEAWDARGAGAIPVDRVDEARTLFEEVARPLLARLSDSEAALERARLFGSAASIGVVDVVLGLEASRPQDVRERWLEYRLDGDFSLGAPAGRRVALKGVADRVDLLAGNRLRVIDYKSGAAPSPARALQAGVYALCARERLEARGRGAWTVDEAAYVAFAGKRAVVPVVPSGSPDADAVLGRIRSRVVALVDGVERGEFPVRPHDPQMCAYCAYPSVCRKDYVGDD